MTTSKGTSPKTKTAKSPAASTSDIEPKHVGKDTLNADKDNIAQAAFGRVKEAIPSFDKVAETVRKQTDVDFQNMSDDAVTFVRRNPVASVAAAAGIGILIGVLATKRS